MMSSPERTFERALAVIKRPLPARFRNKTVESQASSGQNVVGCDGMNRRFAVRVLTIVVIIDHAKTISEWNSRATPQ